MMPAAKLADQIEHRGLDGHVQPGCRLVHDEQRRARDQCHRDDDSLLLAARELVRIPIHHGLRVGQLDLGEHRQSASARRRGGHAFVGHRRFHELAADGHDGIQARHRVLIDHGDAPAANREEPCLAEGRQLAPLEADAAAGDPAGAPEIAHDRQRDRGLAAAGLADEPEGLTRVQLEADTPHDDGLTGARRVRDAQIPDVEQRAVSHGDPAPAARPRAG